MKDKEGVEMLASLPLVPGKEFRLKYVKYAHRKGW